MPDSSSGSIGDFFKDTLRAVLFSLVICTALVLVFALLIKVFQISTGAVPIVSQIIKYLSAAAGVFIAVKRPNGFFKGMTAGALYSVFALLIFMLLGGEFSWARFGTDFGIAAAVSAVVGAIGSAVKA